MLNIKNLSFFYDSRKIFENLSLHVKEGQIVTILGPSGSGKTTLFRLISGLEKPYKGTIDIAQQKHPQARDFLSYMMQEDLLLPWRSALDNLLLLKELGLIEKMDSKEYKNTAIKWLKELHLEDAKNLYPCELSGGMRQRLALARSLLLNRPLLLLDEPFGSLDFTTRGNLYKLLLEIQKKHHKTILLITHDFNDAQALSDHVYILSPDGHLNRVSPHSQNKHSPPTPFLFQQIDTHTG